MNESFLERVTPGIKNTAIWQEHVCRYYFALDFVSEKIVLDVACGSGYGTNLLSKKAGMAIGVDISMDALNHAVEHYGKGPHIGFILADAQHLPFRDDLFDVVISFETVEHLFHYRKFLNEIKYLLSKRGKLIISTPNKKMYYSQREGKPANPYHIREFTFKEFSNLLNIFSSQIQTFGQCPYTLKDRILRFFSIHLPSSLKNLITKRRRAVFTIGDDQSEKITIDRKYRVRVIRPVNILTIHRFLLFIVKNEKD